MPAPLPPNETERLQTLARYDVLDSPPDAALDRLTALAARLFHVPIALVSLVDKDRQWFKSRHGLDVCETHRDLSFCAHTILSDRGDCLLVPDATLDPRFADNPLVTGALGIRFYAGAPLRLSNGTALGSFCVIDKQPRAFSGEEVATLRDLAAAAVDTLELHASRRLARAAEDALRESESRVRNVLESIGDAFFCLDRAWRFTYVNDHAVNVLRRSRERLLGRSLWDEFPHAAVSRFGRAYCHAMETGEAMHLEDYSERLQTWIEVHVYPSETGLSIYLRDISDRKEAQRKSDNSHKLLQAIIDGTSDSVYIKDRDGRYLLINPAGAAMLNAPAEAIVGQDDFSFFPTASVHQNRASDLEVMCANAPCTYESCDRIGDIEHFFLTTKSPYRDAEGNLLGIIGVAREITEQRRAAEALREAKEEAEKANLAKSEFLSRMSHELRTPLNAILGFGQLLEISDLGRRETEGVTHILKAGRHLLGLIDEVLAISRIEAGAMNLSLEPVPVAQMAAECLSLVSRLAADRRVTCDFLGREAADAPPGRGVHVLADRQRLRQVLLNLLSNAVKYNREGGRVTLSCRETPLDAAGQRWLRLEVADTGAGLTAAEIGRLFTPFERLGAERTGTEGTGLGLALSKGLVEVMTGHIGADSVPGQGSTFWLELPLARHPLETLADSGRAGLGWNGETSVGTVLYVEDNLSNLRLIEMVMGESPGLRLLSAQQGVLGLEIARARLPDLILLDLHLPDLPGWEVLQMLQDDPLTRHIPVVVISADATPGRIERLKAAGARAYLTKPIDVPALLSVLRQHLKHEALPDKVDASNGTVHSVA